MQRNTRRAAIIYSIKNIKHESFLVNFSSHCFLTIKLERWPHSRIAAKKRLYRREKRFWGNVAQKSINWINKSIFDSCSIESHFYSQRFSGKSCMKIIQRDDELDVRPPASATTPERSAITLSITQPSIDHFDANRQPVSGTSEVGVE